MTKAFEQQRSQFGSEAQRRHGRGYWGRLCALCLFALLIPGCASQGMQRAGVLPSWADTPTRAQITRFVEGVTDPGSPDYVPVEQRIATFDNDGCLWSEQPVYFQLLFAMDRVRQLAPQRPEWATTQPFKAVLENDMETLHESGTKGIMELVMATHAGLTTEEFDEIVRDWLATSRHPTKHRPYTEMVYQPMLELLDYLRANGFKTFIVSGGGIDFIRTFSEEVYGIPPEQVIGSSIKTKFEMRATGPVIVRRPEIDFIDDKEGKPIAIHRVIGRRPIASFGNSDGDLQMLQWTAAGDGPRLMLLVHHTDGGREWAYDRESAVGKLDVALGEAEARGWIVVDMENDWDAVHPK